jgi:hypothetical protein
MLEKVTNEIINKILLEIKKEENISKLQINVIDPLIHYTFSQLYPYILGTSIIFILIFVLTLVILFLIMKLNIKM